jgi:hypothetical protein
LKKLYSVVSLALKTKTNKSTYDDLLIKLFEASVRYSKFSKSVQNLEELHLNYFESEFENIILLIWQEWHFGVMERLKMKNLFLYKLAEMIKILMHL